jgi:glycosyltransferase involved in cell wall biosynthesis
MAFINILFPVYNEKLRLEKGIRQTISYMETNYQNEYVLTIVDNASTDETQEIAK